MHARNYPANISKILLTGGGLKLRSHESKRSLKSELIKTLEDGSLLGKYPNVNILGSDEP